jgi:hypothetical protein
MSETIIVPGRVERRLPVLAVAVVAALAFATAAVIFLFVTAIGDAGQPSPSPAPAIDAEDTTDSIVLTRWADCERQDDVVTPC